MELRYAPANVEQHCFGEESKFNDFIKLLLNICWVFFKLKKLNLITFDGSIIST